ncbi:hypothetical protein YUWDRAFT_04222 [Streptomyces sp. AmelKG-D3]|nr:hypothetical protein YUWDRAFT_04222 [Streptomyces sp. AmelKG-D3]
MLALVIDGEAVPLGARPAVLGEDAVRLFEPGPEGAGACLGDGGVGMERGDDPVVRAEVQVAVCAVGEDGAVRMLRT